MTSDPHPSLELCCNVDLLAGYFWPLPGGGALFRALLVPLFVNVCFDKIKVSCEDEASSPCGLAIKVSDTYHLAKALEALLRVGNSVQ